MARDRITIAGAALVAVGACSSGSAPTVAAGNAAEPSVSSKVDLFTYAPATAVPGQPAPTYNMVAASGRLVIERGCIVLATTARRLALVFRQGSVRFDERRQVLTVDGHDHPIGSTVMVGGSGGSGVAAMPAEDVRARCGADDVWAVAPGSMRRAS